jgi:hypothetical protein
LFEEKESRDCGLKMRAMQLLRRLRQPMPCQRHSWVAAFDRMFKVPALDSIELQPIEVRLWKALSDKDYGGSSECIAEVDNNNSSRHGAMVFQGIVNFSESTAEATNAVGGFCAVKGFLQRPVDLRDYMGFSMELRSIPAQVFTFNMTCESLFEDDLYQLELLVTEEWTTVHLPFHLFKLTARGTEREFQRRNDSLRLESIGFLMKLPNGKKGRCGLMHL